MLPKVHSHVTNRSLRTKLRGLACRVPTVHTATRPVMIRAFPTADPFINIFLKIRSW
uniref:Uncharacterized protein n=1 Tax=Anguilla anguilla TaxID=7936 RepID=A0A0E9RNE0_ANGAN